MRRLLLAGLVLSAAGPAFGQTAAPVPPAAVQEPAAGHPWAVQPQHGEWMVCVKSYTGPDAMKFAEELAGHIRKTHNAAAYLHEFGREEREREDKRRQEFRQRKAQELTPFLATQARLKEEAKRDGVDFVETPTKFRMPTVNVPTEWGVLVGGWKDMDTAGGALQTIRKWPAPTQPHLMTRAVITRPGDGKATAASEGTYINPFAEAIVGKNPSLKRTAPQEVPVDPLIAKMNAKEQYSLLECPKAWTLSVKDFATPTSVQPKGQTGTAIGRLFGGDESGRALDATVDQARGLAKYLRGKDMEEAAKAAAGRLGMNPRPLEAYVLHLQTGSRVTVGGFDSPDDPALLEMQRLLANMSFKAYDKPPSQGGRQIGDEQRYFNGVTPIPVPRAASGAASGAAR